MNGLWHAINQIFIIFLIEFEKTPIVFLDGLNLKFLIDRQFFFYQFN